ncbi:diacylglycerol kinase family lipid kinase [soil metagenome]
MQVTLMHNPNAGSGKPSPEKLKERFKESGYELKYQSTKKDNYESALENPGEIIIIAGGDGTIGKITKKLINRDVKIGVIPAGTANNIAKTLNINASPKKIINKLSTYKTIGFDVGEVKGIAGERKFIESVGIGLFPELMNFYKQNPEKGPDKKNKEKEVEKALKQLKKRLTAQSAFKCKICIDGEIFSDNFLLIEIMNIKTMGPNLPLAAEADPGDGFLDIVMVSERERESFISYLDGYIEGKTPPLDLAVRKGRHVQIFWDNHLIHIDDELWPDPEDEKPDFSGKNAVIDIELIPQALQVLVPEKS